MNEIKNNNSNVQFSMFEKLQMLFKKTKAHNKSFDLAYASMPSQMICCRNNVLKFYQIKFRS